MTVRKLLQAVGTDIFRKIDKNIWVRKLFQNINEVLDNNEFSENNGKYSYKNYYAIIDDLRFLGEVESLKKHYGKTIYLTRQTQKSFHESETELDNHKSNFDFIIDNKDYTLEQLEKEINKIAVKILQGK